MRFRVPLLTLGLTGLYFAVPHLVHATGIPFTGPIVPHNIGYGTGAGADKICTGGWGGFIQVINNLIAFALTIGITVVAPFSFVYAGFLFVVNSVNSEGLSKAKRVLWNTVIGIVISLAAWLIVDMILTSLTSKGLTGDNSWTAKLFDRSGECLAVAGDLSQAAYSASISTGGPGLQVSGNGLNYTNVTEQLPRVSPELGTLLTCMSANLPAQFATITALTDRHSGTDTATIAHCDAVGHAGDSACAHTANSCHYGGRAPACAGKTYAADFVTSDYDTLERVAKQCNNSAWLNFEDRGTKNEHLHVSVGAVSGCGCDTDTTDHI